MLGKIISGAAGATASRAAKVAAGPPGGWGNFAFSVSNWDSLFSRWLPSSTRSVTVKVQGAKGTPTKAVLHLALASVFGVLNNRDTKLVNYGLRVEVDHLNNAVAIGFAVTSIAAVEGIRAIMLLLDEAQKEGFFNVEVKDGSKFLEAGVGIINNPLVGALPWLIGNALGFGGDIKQALGKGEALLRKVIGILSEKVGAAQVWNMPREEIRGGRAMIGVKSPRQQLPFDRMVEKEIVPPVPFPGLGQGIFAAQGEVLFTRKPAANPQPPAALGDDVRTLVAQVLHDPGVRPPTPVTDLGPPTAQEP